MYITAQGCRLRNDLYCVEWDVKLSSRESWVTGHAGQLTDGSHVSWVIKCDQLSAVRWMTSLCCAAERVFDSVEISADRRHLLPSFATASAQQARRVVPAFRPV